VNLTVAFSAALLAGLAAPRAFAQDPDELDEPGGPVIPERADAEPLPTVRNPQGALLVNGVGGLVTGGGGTAGVIGVGVGYAVVTGIVPGIRGLLIFGDIFGGEVSGTLTLTPPFEGAVTPYAIGEVGHRWEAEARGVIYGAGGGLYLGDPRAMFSLQLGAIYRIWDTQLGRVKGLSPVIGVSVRF
jgi:hypothetical protein